MDSMRGLRTSLPQPSLSRRQPTQTPEQLLQSFKQAALSVTALYKQAAADRADSHQRGYQDAVDDLLAFLDKENIGLQDGEGWKIRSWATERAQGSSGEDVQPNNGAEDEDDDESEEQENRERSSSPTKTNQDVSPADSLILPPPRTLATSTTAALASDSRAISAPPAVASPTESEVKSLPAIIVPSSDFAFRSSHPMPLPQDTDMDSSDSQSSGMRVNVPAASPMQMNYVSRPHRISHRSNGSNRQNSRSSNSASLGTGAGSKRKVPLESWFDISGFNGKDGSQGGAASGGKRGRYA